MSAKKSTVVKTTKIIVRTVVGFSAGFVVGNVIGNNTNPESTLQYAEVAIGSAVIGLMVADYAGQYTDRLIDDIVATGNEIEKRNKANLQSV